MKDIPFWLNDPTILYDKNKIFNIWPLENFNKNEKLNSITRLIIILTFIGYLITKNYFILITAFITIIIIVFIHKNFINQLISKKNNFNNIKEGFTDQQYYHNIKHNLTNPNKNNPYMNVMLSEINSNPNRKESAPAYNKAVEPIINESVKQIVRDNFNDNSIDSKIYDNEQEFTSNNRQFYTTPNTRIPNNQKAFAKFCYGKMAHDKDIEYNN